MKAYLIAYAVMLVLFPAIDFLWIGVAARGLYQSQIGQLLTPHPKLVPAVLFYALYAAGVLIFVVGPGLGRDDWRRTLGMAALFGVIAYSVYDLTNLSTLRDFTLTITLADMAWGAVLTGVVGSLGRWASLRFA
jgi:uncharacterized membrane protein